MKIINSLIVVEVPKDAVMHRILGSTVQWDSNEHMADTHAELPPGQYEIIGLYSEVVNNLNSNIAKRLIYEPDMVTYFGIPIYTNYLHPKDWNQSFLCPIDSLTSMIEANQLTPTDTTDLLFIRKIK